MIINLKQINLSDSDNIKLDKINYNFDQLVANGGGPMGSTGPVGDQGATGITGAQGYQGPIGPTGTQGTPGANTTAYWKNIAGGGNVPVDTILPIHDTTVSTHPPVVSVGFISGDSEYAAGQNTSGGQLPYQWIINRRSNYQHNLKFTSSDVIGNSFNFRMEKVQNSPINKFTMGFQNIVDTAIIWHAQKHIFTDNITGNSLLDINDFNITYYKDVEFDRPVTVNGQLKVGNANAATDKIAVAADNGGTVTFKSIDELGGIVPYGTIVSILPSIFSNNNNFVNSENVTLANVNDLLKIRVGKGINDYSGWYICNGKTWLGETSQLQHTVPDLNSFSYTIQDNQSTINLNSQGSASVTNTETHLVGGANIQMNAVNVAPSVYGIASNVITTDSTISSATGTTFKIKKLPQIIYLGDDDCYWQDMGANQAPAGTNTYIVNDLNETSSGSPTVTVTSQQAIQGGSFIQYINVSAAPGFYFDQSVSGGAFTTATGYDVVFVTMGNGSTPTSFTLTIQVSSHGAPGAIRTITFDSSSFVAQVPTTNIVFGLSDDSTISGVTINPSSTILNTFAGIPGSTSNFGGSTLVVNLQAGREFTQTNYNGATAVVDDAIDAFNGNLVASITSSKTPFFVGMTSIVFNFSENSWPTSSVSRFIRIDVASTQLAPKLTDGGSIYVGPLMNPSGNESSATVDALTVVNNTGTTKFLYLTINNFTTGSTSGNATVGAMWEGLSAAASAPQSIVTSSNYVTIANGQTINDIIEINAVGDNYYQVYLQWSNSPGGALTPINY